MNQPPPPGRLALFAWCTYDWANSAFPTVITTFVFSAYFAKVIAADEVTGISDWAFALSASGLAVAVASPLLGAIADAAGRRKPWVAAFSALCIAATAALWPVVPDAGWALYALALVALANFAFEMGIVFYNAMLPAIAPPGMMGRLSGWAWGLGYVGGLTCLFLALALVRPEPPPLGLDAAAHEPVRATALLVAGWFALFCLPFFVLVPEGGAPPRPALAAVREGLAALRNTVRQLRRYRNVFLYLLAHMVYADGLNTLFAVGGIYVAVTFAMAFEEILLFGIAINITAGLGAFAFGWVDDRLGSKPTILIALLAMCAIGVGLIAIDSKTWMWALALPLGLFFGPAQAASRTLMARLAPPHLSAEFFGLYALAGKATAFVGPAVFGTVTAATGSQRWGMATIIAFLAVGAALLLPVRAERPPADA